MTGRSTTDRAQANRVAFERMCGADPVLVDIRPAIEAVPGMTHRTILTSGPRLPWPEYSGGQREAIIGAALYQRLAQGRDEAIALLDAGAIVVRGCQELGCVGSLAGVYCASMPVFVVEDRAGEGRAFCNFYEGHNPKRLNYGVYDDTVRTQLDHVHHVVAPLLAEAVRLAGGVALRPIMTRALHMGDELHSRNTAASLLFARELFPFLMRMSARGSAEMDATLDLLTSDHYFFLRLSMAAAKLMADAAHGVEGSSVVSAMAFNCREFGIRVSGLGDEWFVGPHPTVHAKLFDGHDADEITWMGGESILTETVGLGGFAQAAAFPLQAYQGGSAETMVNNNLAMYGITTGENLHFKIPYLGYRGSPTGIDVLQVIDSGITPVMDIGIAGRNGGQIGAGLVRASLGCFESAAAAYVARYGR